MPIQLKSNFKYVWWNLLGSLFLTIAGAISAVVCFVESAESVGKRIAIFLCALLMLALGIFGLVRFLLDWQWVTVYEDRIKVRCLLFEIHSIPVEKVKRCWVCPVWIQYYKSRGATYDFLVIDTAKTRKKHTIPDGYSSRKHRYIILPDSLENRLVLQNIGLMVEK